ncbi:cytochrome-c peroxidase [Vibrio sp. WXL103]|uniref:cytochrome-c peroxidase n=1 Tax=unclassified Vibrio TaxID=2614977 RepID=UPI003EC8F8BC
MGSKKLILGCGTILLFCVGLLIFEVYKSSSGPFYQDDIDALVIAKDNPELSHKEFSSEEHNNNTNTHSVNADSTSTGSTNLGYVDPSLPIQPILPVEDIDIEKARVGWFLFRDPGLSSNNQVSCESCHNLQTNGAELIPVSLGVHGAGQRNSLTVFNVVYNYRFFWDGRVNSLEEQLDGPVHNPVEMDSTWENIFGYVSQSEKYQSLFSDAGLEINIDTIKGAIVEFERALTTLGAPFDRYLAGDAEAINPSAQRGWQAFQSEGCIACHQGTNVGGGLVMRFGYFGQDKTGSERSSDLGRFATTSKPEDRHLFRVPSLRNVGDTAPYFHDGKTQQLTDAIKIMGQSQLGKELDESTIEDIYQFLLTLSGQRPAILEEFEHEND